MSAVEALAAPTEAARNSGVGRRKGETLGGRALQVKCRSSRRKGFVCRPTSHSSCLVSANPTNHFTAVSLDNRASDINNLLDGISNGVQVLHRPRAEARRCDGATASWRRCSVIALWLGHDSIETTQTACMPASHSRKQPRQSSSHTGVGRQTRRRQSLSRTVGIGGRHKRKNSTPLIRKRGSRTCLLASRIPRKAGSTTCCFCNGRRRGAIRRVTQQKRSLRGPD